MPDDELVLVRRVYDAGALGQAGARAPGWSAVRALVHLLLLAVPPPCPDDRTTTDHEAGRRVE